MTTIRRPPNFSSACAEPQRLCERSFECLPLVPAICSASRSNSSPSALSPTCCTHSNSACLLRAIPSIIGSNSCCVVNSRPPPACFASRLLCSVPHRRLLSPSGTVLLARPILRPAGSRRYLFKFQHSGGHCHPPSAPHIDGYEVLFVDTFLATNTYLRTYVRSRGSICAGESIRGRKGDKGDKTPHG